MHKKPLALLVALGLLASPALTACGGNDTGSSSGQSGTSGGSQTIDMAITQSADSDMRQTLQTMADEFKADTGIEVNLLPSSNSYESDIKIRMGANDLPDIFATHGWSVKRYKDFLEPLTDEEWAQYVNPMLDSAMRDADGNLYALPLELDTTGVIYNKDVFDSLGIDPTTLTTWDAFTAAAQKVKDSGITPLFAEGKNQYYPGNVANLMAPGFYSEADLQSLLDGTFPDQPWLDVTTKIYEWQQAGFFNPDFVSATGDDMSRAIAEGDAAMGLAQNGTAANAFLFKPDANLGVFPVPNDSGDPYLMGGEGVNSFGVAKNGNVEAAKQFIAFMAQPKNATQLVRGTGNPPGLTNVEGDLGTLNESFDNATENDVPLVPYFDRVYMPNGMWGPMCDAVASILAGTGDPESALKTVRDNYDSLYGVEE